MDDQSTDKALFLDRLDDRFNGDASFAQTVVRGPDDAYTREGAVGNAGENSVLSFDYRLS